MDKCYALILSNLSTGELMTKMLSHTCSSSTCKTFSCLVQSQCSSPSRHSPHLQRQRQCRRHAGQHHRHASQRHRQRQRQREWQRQRQQTNFCIRAMRITLASAADILVSSHTHRTYAYVPLYNRRSVLFWGVGPLL